MQSLRFCLHHEDKRLQGQGQILTCHIAMRVQKYFPVREVD